MALANVALTDTFDTWRIRTNQLCSLYDQTNTAVIAAVSTAAFSYTQSNLAFSQANAAYAFGNVVSGNAKAAFIQANAAYVRANSKISTIEGVTGRTTATANGATSYIVDLATTGAGAGSYSTGISDITVDAYGRVTSITGSANYQTALGFTPVQQGGGTGQGANKVYIGWASSVLNLQVDATNFGSTWPIGISGTAAKASTLSQNGGTGLAMTFNYVGQVSQPTWLWGTNDGTNIAVWNPANFSVNYASTAGNFNNGAILSTGNQINSYPSYAGNGGEVAFNYVGYNGGTAYTRNVSMYDGKNALIALFNGPDRSLYCWGNITAYYTSDISLKTNIKPIQNALDKLDAIRGVEFDWTKEHLDKCPDNVYFNKSHDVGVIAQEIEKVLPEVVSTRDDGIKAVKYDKIVPLLIQAIKELKAEVETLKRG